ncbi:MAG: VWA domain-containing protein [Acidobacteriaceae bacterium]|jgi:VWFA-related protein
MALVMALGLRLCLPTAQAQQNLAGPSSNEATTLQVYSRLTIVDVTATDATGQAIHGLTQSDFTILEDGKPQPIRNFEEVGERPVMPIQQLPPHVYTNLQPPPPSSAVNIILLDFANEAPVDSQNTWQVGHALQLQNYVKQAAIAAVDQMPAGTRVAVIAMTNSLHIMQGFTSDPEILKAAINAAPLDLDGNGNQQDVQADMRNRMVLETFSQIAADTAALKGRKNLIWFAMGNPALTDPNHGGSLPDYSKSLSLAYDALTASQVSIYPLAAQGVGRLRAAQLSLEQFAEATGGIAYSETNDMSTAVLKAIDNGANYYSIAYIPPDPKYDGVYHKIQIKVDQPGVKLDFRTGYYADDLSRNKMPVGLTLSMNPPAAAGGSMKAPMSRGMPTSTQILFDVGVDPSNAQPKPADTQVLGTLAPNLQGKRLTRYAFQYVIPSQQIVFADGTGKTHKASLDFDIAVYDANDKLLTGLSQTIKTNLSDSTYRAQLQDHSPIRFQQQIDLPPGQLFVRVGVLDHANNQTGTLELPLKVAKK